MLGKKHTTDVTLKEMEQKNKSSSDQIVNLQKEVDSLVKENRQLKKTINAYQLWSKIPGGIGSQPVATSYHRCRYCSKVFNSDYYLESHLVRRHPDKPNYVADGQNVAPINAAQSRGQSAQVDGNLIDKITETIERFSSKVMETERKLREDMEQKLKLELSKKEKQIEDAYRSDRLEHEKELQDLKTLMVQQLEDERKLLREERLAFEELRKTQMKKSNVGQMEDDFGNDNQDGLKEVETKYENLVKSLHKKFETELGNLNDKISAMARQEDSRQLRQIGTSLDKVSQSDRELHLKNKGIRSQLKSEPLITDTPQSLFRSSRNLTNAGWDKYDQVLKEFKHSPISDKPEIKTIYDHTEEAVISNKQEMQQSFEALCENKGITLETTKSSDQVQKVNEHIAANRKQLESKNSNHKRMREAIEKEVETIYQSKFKLKPFNELGSSSNVAPSIPLPDKQAFFSKHNRQKSDFSSMNSVAWSEYQDSADSDGTNDDEFTDTVSYMSLDRARSPTGAMKSPSKRGSLARPTSAKTKSPSSIDALNVTDEFDISDISDDNEFSVSSNNRVKSSKKSNRKGNHL